MANRYWIGGSAGNVANNTANWSASSGGSTGASVPGTSDTAIFDSNSNTDCVWDIATVGAITCELPSAASETPGVDYGYFNATTNTPRIIQFQNDVTISTGPFTINCDLKATAARKISIASNGTGNKLFIFGELTTYTNKSNFTFAITSSATSSSTGSQFFLEKGEYPNVTIGVDGSGTPRLNVGYVASSATVDPNFEAVDFYTLNLDGPTLATNDPINNRDWKYIVRDALTITGTLFDTGETTWELYGSSGGRRLPVTGDTSNFGSGGVFVAYWNKIILSSTTAGHYHKITDGLTLVCNELIINSDLRPENNTNYNLIKVNSTPTVHGSWDFYDVGGGFYHSDPQRFIALPPNIGTDGQVLKIANGVTGWGTDSGVSLSGSTDNTIVTVTGSNAIQGESNLTFDGSTFAVTGSTGRVGIGTTSLSARLHIDNVYSKTTLNGAFTAIHSTTDTPSTVTSSGATTITLTDASAFSTSGSGQIGGDAFTWSGKSSNDLTGVSGISGDKADNTTVTEDKGMVLHDSSIFGSSGTASINGDNVTFTANSANTLTVTGVSTNYSDGASANVPSDTDAIRVDVDSSDAPDSTPFVVAEDGRVGIGTSSPVSGKALTLNGDGTSYEGIAFQTGGSTKFQMSIDSSNFYHDNSINGGGVAFRNRTSSGTLRPGLFLDTAGDAFVHAIGNDDQGGSAMTPMNALQINVGKAASGVYDKSNGLIIVNNDGSNAADDLLAGIGFDSRGGNVPSSVTEASAGILAYASQAHTATEKGGYLTFVTSATNDNDDTTSHERMRIEADGNVGIGTTSPDARLHVSTGTDLNCGIIIEADTDDNDDADLPFLWLKQDGDKTVHAFQGTDNRLQIINNVSGSGGIDFLVGTTNNTGTTNPATGATEALSIESGGGVQARKRVIKDANAYPSNTLASSDSGKTVYWTGIGSLDLPDNAKEGEYFVIINNTGSSRTPGLGSGNSIASSWASHSAMADNTVRTYVCVSNGDWIFHS